MDETKPTWTLERLTEVANDFLRKHYQLTLTVPIVLNGRLKMTIGRFLCDPEELKPIRIELAKTLLLYYTDEEIQDVLRHELVHYALFILDKPCFDGHEYFENELKCLKVSSANLIPYKGKVFVYECEQCGMKMVSESKLNLNHYESACCGKDFRLAMQTVVRTNEDWDKLIK